METNERISQRIDERAALNMDPATYHYHLCGEVPQKLLISPIFNAIWDEIKEWDVNVPYAYAGYCSANGSHVYSILLALHNAGIIDVDEVMQDAVSNPRLRLMRTTKPESSTNDPAPPESMRKEQPNEDGN